MARRRSTTTRRRSYRRTSSTSTARVKPRARYTITESFITGVVEEVYNRLGLETLGLRIDELFELLKPIVESIVDQYSSRPSKEQVANRIVRHVDRLYELIAYHLLETREEFTDEQLDLIVNYVGRALPRYIQKLYEVLKRKGRDDLIELLRGKWLETEMATPYPCPRCGFYALTPNLSCIVCGAEIDEKEFKEVIDFRSKLQEFVEIADVNALREVLYTGRIVVDGEQLKPPSAARSLYAVELSLDTDELKLVEEWYKAKKQGVSSASL